MNPAAGDPPREATGQRRARSRDLLLVLATAVGVYANSIPNGFTFDDRWIIERNPNVRGIDRIPAIWTSGYWGEEKATRHYRPITVTTYALNYAAHGLRPAGYHLVNVLLHAVASLLVLVLTVRLGGSAAAGLCAGLLFAVHPIHTDAVAGVVGRAELLSAIAFIAAFLFWLRFRDGGRRGDLFGLAAFYALALLSKEHTVVLPALLVASEAARTQLRDAAGRGRLVQALFACLAALSIALALRHGATGSFGERHMLEIGPQPGLLFGEPFTVRVLTVCKVLFRIARLLLFPIPLSPDYSYAALPVARGLELGVVAGAVLAAAAAWALARAWRSPGPFTLGSLALLTWLPVSNLAAPITLLLGERTLYLPSVGLAGAAGIWFAGRVSRMEPRAARAAWALALAIGALYAARTVDRNRDWRSQLSLFSEAARTTPLSARVHLNLGLELQREGKLEAAAHEFDRAGTILPEYEKAHVNLAVAYQGLGRYDDAAEAMRRAIRVRPDRADSWVRLGEILLGGGHPSAAVEAFRRALALEPGNPAAAEGLGAAGGARAR